MPSSQGTQRCAKPDQPKLDTARPNDAADAKQDEAVGTNNEINAKDSQNASANTIGAAQLGWLWTNKIA